MAPSGRILVTGGTGKTGRRLVAELDRRGVPCTIGCRHPGSDERAVHFDWARPATWAAALEGIEAAYLVAPTDVGDPAPLMTAFVGAATRSGVRRFVLLSASIVDAGGPVMGVVHRHLSESSLEWTVLRPTWFMENFTEASHADTIRSERCIYSATGDGRVPFISADDIAWGAAVALTAASPRNDDYVLTGTQALSYDTVAEMISAALGEPVRHVHLTFDEQVQRLCDAGLELWHAQTLALTDLVVAEGAEDRITPGYTELTGRAARSFEDFVASGVAAWR